MICEYTLHRAQELLSLKGVDSVTTLFRLGAVVPLQRLARLYRLPWTSGVQERSGPHGWDGLELACLCSHKPVTTLINETLPEFLRARCSAIGS